MIYASIQKIKENDANPRLIKDDKFEKLCNSLREFPQMLELRPIIVNLEYIVLGGNMRLKAAKEIGLKEIPVIVANTLTQEQQREFTIKDNLGYGEWDYEILNADWDRMQLEEWGLEIPEFMHAAEAIEEDFKEHSDLDTIKTDIMPGDIIRIGAHRIICGDSLDINIINKVLDGQIPDLIFTDPMYQDDPREIINSLLSAQSEHFLIMATFKQCIDYIVESGLNFRFDLVLNQHTPSSTLNKKVPYYLHKNIVYLTRHDESIFNCDNARGYFSDKGYFPSVIEAPKNTQEAHGLTKNSEAIMKILSGFSCKTVFDPFIGSGTTLLAAHALGRICYGVEINPKYCQVIVDRATAAGLNVVIITT